MSRSIGKNFAWNAAYQLLLILTPLLTTPYLSRVLGPEQVGVYSYTYSVAAYFAMFGILGMAQHGVRAIAQAGSDRARRSRVFWSAWASQLCVAVPVTIMYAVYVCFDSVGGVVVGAVWALQVLSSVIDVSWLYFGVEEFRLPTLRSFATKLAGVAAIFLFVRGPQDLWIYCLSISGATFLNAVLLLPFLRRYVDFAMPSWGDVKAHFAPNLRLFAPVVAISVYTSLDKIMLGQISGMEQAGFYEYSEKLSKMPLALVTAMGTVMLPRMTAELSEGKEGDALALLGKSLCLMEAVAMCMAFGIAAIAPEFAVVFLGQGYEQCMYIMPVVAIVIPIISASNVIGVQYMLPRCSDVAYTLSVCAGAVMNVALNLALLPHLGAMGAAISTVAAEVAVLAVQCWVVRKDLPLAKYAVAVAPFLLTGLAMFFGVRGAAGILVSAVGLGWVSLIVEVAVGAGVYCLLTGLLIFGFQRKRRLF